MIFRNTAFIIFALAASVSAFTGQSPFSRTNGAIMMSDVAEDTTSFDKSLQADIRKEVCFPNLVQKLKAPMSSIYRYYHDHDTGKGQRIDHVRNPLRQNCSAGRLTSNFSFHFVLFITA